MRIAFIDVTAWNYTVDTPYQIPLGGSQSAMCYLAQQLAKLGHDVRLYNRADGISTTRGVICAPLERVSAAAWKELDVVVVQNWAKLGIELRPKLRRDAKLVLWTQHADDQPAIAALANAEIREAHDAFVFVSDWQREQYVRRFSVDPARSQVLRNAIGPAFERMFSPGQSILAAKSQPPVLAYTSTPFRGLDVLVDAFPAIRAEISDVRLRVFSSMQVYQTAPDRDAEQFGQLYERCRNTPGIEYVGSLPQPQLAAELRTATMLAYPNTFAETSCIAVMEALASGCQVVTSELGALPETTDGCGVLVPHSHDGEKFQQRFTRSVVACLQSMAGDRLTAEIKLAQQVSHMNERCTWHVRARQWQSWLGTLLIK